MERTAYPEGPPRVEYKLTDFGQRFVSILDAVAELQREIGATRADLTVRWSATEPLI